MKNNHIKLPPEIYEQLDIVVNPNNAALATRAKPFTREEIIDFLELWASGMTHQEIADLRGVKKARIRNCFANKMLDVSSVRKMRYMHTNYGGIKRKKNDNT